MANDLRTLTVSLVANTGGFQRDMTNARRQVGMFNTSTNRLSGGMGGLIKSFGLMAGAGGALALLTGQLKSGITTAISFESAFAAVKKTVDATTDEYTAMRKELIQLSKQTGATAESLFEAAGSAGQLSVAKEDIVEFTRIMSEMALSTDLTAEEAAIGFAKWSNITQITKKELDNLTSAVVALGNKSGAFESNILAISLRFAGVAKSVGLTDAEIAGLGATITEVGIEAEAGGTSISSIFEEIQRATVDGGKQLELFAALSGRSIKQFKDAFKVDAAGTLLDVAQGFDSFIKAGGVAIEVMDTLKLDADRVGRTFRSLAGNIDKAKQNLDLATQAFEDNTARSAEAEERYKTAATKIDKMKASFSALKNEIFDDAIPAVNSFTEALSKFFDVLSEDDNRNALYDTFNNGLIFAGLNFMETKLENIGKLNREAFSTKPEAGAAKAGEAGAAGGVGVTEEDKKNKAGIDAIVKEETGVGRLFKRIGKGWEAAKEGAKDFWESSKDYAIEFSGQIGEIWDENFNWEKDPERQGQFIDSIFDALIKAGDEYENKEQERIRLEQERLKLIDEENAKQQKMMDEQIRAREKEKELLRDMLNQDVGAFQAQRRGSYTGFNGGVVGISAEGLSEVGRRAASSNNARTGPDASTGLLQGILTAAQATAQNTRNGQIALAG
jgi:TP901 family phage tail tape measure protein